MNFEQIMIRLGVDGTMVKTGLGKIGSQVKAWGQSLAHGMKEYTGGIMKGFIGAEAVTKAFEYLGELKNSILEVARVSKETGASTNFIQGLETDAAKAGTTFQGMDMSLVRFNKLIGEAKFGSADAIKKLYDLGIISNGTEIKTLNFTSSMNKLAVSFDKLNDKQKQSALLMQAFGKGSAAMSIVFEQGAKHVEELSQGNFFTKISESAVDDFETVWRTIKSGTKATMATVINTIDVIPGLWKKAWQVLGTVSTGRFSDKEIKGDLASIEESNQKVTNDKQLQAIADKDGISVQEEKVKIIEAQNDLLEKQAELTSQIVDRDKESVAEMASRARKLTGIKGPLEMLHTITPRMRTALRIETLEERAKVAFLRGDDSGSNRMQGEADQIRKSNPWLKRSDVNPMSKTEIELGKVNEQLEPVKRMAELVNSNK